LAVGRCSLYVVLPTDAERKKFMKKFITAVAVCAATMVPAADSPDLTMQTRIRQEGLSNSRVMETASGLMDGIGARLTGSPNMKRANEWTRDKLTEFGLSNAHLGGWGPFGPRWHRKSRSSAQSPRPGHRARMVRCAANR